MVPSSRLQTAKAFTSNPPHPNSCGPCSPCKEGAKIERRIIDLYGEIANLEARHALVQTKINEIHDPLNHKLPPEIVSHVFTLSCPRLPFHEEFRGEWAMPLILGAVCRKWRHIAWSNPFLWTTIFLNIALCDAKKLAGPLPQLVTEWLERSGVLPLTIQFFIERPKEGEDYNEVERLASLIIGILNQYSERWENLDLDFPPALFLQRFHGSSELANIKRFSIIARKHDYGHRLPPGTLQLFRKEIRPKCLILDRFETPFNISGFNIAWGNMTRMVLRSVPAELCTEAAKKAHRLEDLRLRAIKRSTDESETGYVQNSSLRSLNIEYPEDQYGLSYVEIMDRMDLPSLRELSCVLNSEPISLDRFFSFLKRSSCHLNTLALNDLSQDTVDLRILLEAIPSLENLALIYWYPDNQPILNDIFDQLCKTPSGVSATESAPQLLPHLRTLYIWARDEPFSWDCVPNIFRSSNRGSLSMEFRIANIHMEDMVAFQLLELLDEGRNLVINIPVYNVEHSNYLYELDFIQQLRERAATIGLRGIQRTTGMDLAHGF